MPEMVPRRQGEGCLIPRLHQFFAANFVAISTLLFVGLDQWITHGGGKHWHVGAWLAFAAPLATYYRRKMGISDAAGQVFEAIVKPSDEPVVKEGLTTEPTVKQTLTVGPPVQIHAPCAVSVPPPQCGGCNYNENGLLERIKAQHAEIDKAKKKRKKK